MFDIGKAHWKANIIGARLGIDPNDIVNAEREASIMGLQRTGDYLEDYGANVILATKTNLTAQQLSDIEREARLMNIFNDD